jgi:nicotinamide-nucleotide amidase
MRAAILSIGDELTLGTSVDTNTAWLSRTLVGRAVRAIEHRTVEDHRDAICTTIRELTGQYDLLIVTGGLGPTDDDLTRFGLGDVIDPGEDLVLDEDTLEQVARWFRRRPGGMPESNRVQAMRPVSARFLPNRRGTAPGLAAEHDGCLIFALPGPPHEMKAMFEAAVEPALPDSGGNALVVRRVHSCGLGESQAAERLGDLTTRGRVPEVGTTAGSGVVTAHVRAWGPRDDVEPKVAAVAAEIASAWNPYVFGEEDVTLPAAVGSLLIERGLTLATAESCTGGWLGQMLVDVPDASRYYAGGWVTYSDELKRSCLGVPAAMIEEHGAVSGPVARAMADGAIAAAGTDLAVAITGLAGPSGGTEEKPVGTVYIAVAGGDGPTVPRRFRLPGDRTLVRRRSCLAALQMIRFAVLGVGDGRRLLGEVEEGVPT